MTVLFNINIVYIWQISIASHFDRTISMYQFLFGTYLHPISYDAHMQGMPPLSAKWSSTSPIKIVEENI